MSAMRRGIELRNGLGVPHRSPALSLRGGVADVAMTSLEPCAAELVLQNLRASRSVPHYYSFFIFQSSGFIHFRAAPLQHTTDSLAKLSTFHFRFSTLSHSLLFGIFI